MLTLKARSVDLAMLKQHQNISVHEVKSVRYEINLHDEWTQELRRRLGVRFQLRKRAVAQSARNSLENCLAFCLGPTDGVNWLCSIHCYRARLPAIATFVHHRSCGGSRMCVCV